MSRAAGHTTDPMIPLDAFNDLIAGALGEATTESALEKIVRVARQTIPNAEEVSVTMLRDNRPSTVAFTGRLAIDLDESQYARGYGPCLDAAVGGGICKIDDMPAEARWADYTRAAAEQGCLSSLSVPLPEQGAVTGALNIYARRPHAFGDEACEIGRSVAAFTAVAVRTLNRHDSARREAEELQRAMQTRAVIEQAKGVLMCRYSCNADDAFARLVQTSQASNVKLRDVATALVEQAAAGGGATD